MTATVTGGGPATGGAATGGVTATGGTATGGTATGGTATGGGTAARRAARRRRFSFPRASTTPGKVRLIRLGLVIACLAWGALAALMVGQHASAARDAASVSEPLSLDAQQMYQSLADADVTASTGYLYGRIQPFQGRQRGPEGGDGCQPCLGRLRRQWQPEHAVHGTARLHRLRGGRRDLQLARV